MNNNCYQGPAGIILTPDEVLEIWRALNLVPTAANATARDKIKRHLENGSGGGQEPVKGTVTAP